MNRRSFLILTAGFTLTAAPLSAASFPAVAIEPSRRSALSAAQWQAMDRLLNHLFPSENDAPGAKEIYATAWLHNALTMPDVEQQHRDFMRDGVLMLERTSGEIFHKAFIELDETQRETTLRQLEKSAEGRAWLQETLRYVLEALLIDPVYGANPNAVGWKWLQHRPGFPQPPANKRYFLL
jgi:gluconate 2-dehydrogenase gamma chain